MGEWLRTLADGLEAAEKGAERRRALWGFLDEARFKAEDAQSDEEQERHYAEVGRLRLELDSIPTPADVTPPVIQHIRDVASEVESASDTRATQLLSLASQFDAFRASLNDPATWVRNLGSAPYGTHVRTTAAWEAFATAEPVLARSLGTVAGKRAVFAAMDKRFGARRKLAGYEGWRGVRLPE